MIKLHLEKMSGNILLNGHESLAFILVEDQEAEDTLIKFFALANAAYEYFSAQDSVNFSPTQSFYLNVLNLHNQAYLKFKELYEAQREQKD